MRVPAPLNDGMGSLLESTGCRFRVWAPNASRVQVVLDNISNAPAFDLGPEPGTGNWSADQVAGIGAGRKVQYVSTNQGGTNNDNSHLWYRTDARAQQVESSVSTSMGYVIDPSIFTTSRQAFTTPAFPDFLIY